LSKNQVTNSVRYRLGYEQGFADAKKVVLDELESIVVNDRSLKRGSPQYNYTLELTRKLAANMREAQPEYVARKLPNAQ